MEKKYFIDPYSNDQFSTLRGLTLQELIVQIENFYLSYRNQLDLCDDISIGYEIEFEEYDRSKVSEYLDKEGLEDWKCKNDGSLHGGGEVVSPILHDEKEDWLNLKKVCEFLQQKKAKTNDRTGGHVHVGTQAIGNEVAAWINLILIYTSYEHVMFRFFYGDKIGPRTGIQRYAAPIGDFLYSKLQEICNISEISELEEILGNDRYRSINFNNVPFSRDLTEEGTKKTLEFRGFNGSTNEVILQNNAMLLGNLLNTAKTGKYDKDFVKYKLEHERISAETNFNIFNEVHIKDALEFADLVFTNNLDKVYFLRQYFKGFQNSYGILSAVESKKFVK